MLKICIFHNERNTATIFSNKISECLNEYNIKYTIKYLKDYKKEDISNFHAVLIHIDSDEKGMELAKKIHNSNPHTQIIFISKHTELVFKSIKFRPIAFINPENFCDEEIKEALKFMLKEINLFKHSCIFMFYGDIICIHFNEVTYIESIRHDIFIHTSQGKVKKVSATLENIEKKLKHFGFIRVHSGYIVNYRAVAEIKRNMIILNDNTIIPLSRRRIEDVKKNFFIFTDAKIKKKKKSKSL